MQAVANSGLRVITSPITFPTELALQKTTNLTATAARLLLARELGQYKSSGEGLSLKVTSWLFPVWLALLVWQGGF